MACPSFSPIQLAAQHQLIVDAPTLAVSRLKYELPALDHFQSSGRATSPARTGFQSM
jgi:hypothetical protein